MQTESIRLDAASAFSDLWQLDVSWFEPPNTSRGGWSGVVKTRLKVNEQPISVFIKRQDKHLTRTWQHWLNGIPTFQKEYANIRRLQALDIPTLEPVYFGVQGTKAILVTKALDDFVSLDKLDKDALSPTQIQQLVTAIAEVIRAMHQQRLQHNCLYPKHIFVSQTQHGWNVRLIDLEKLRRCLRRETAQLRDLSSLLRHSDSHWSLTERMRFFKRYVGETRLSPSSKALWKKVARKSGKKRR
jgi:tRNA A-37 threonylcarbamoyl transferase component Bud32